MPPPVTSRADMTRRLRAGEFGNTFPFWTDLRDWPATPDTLWGVQHTIIAGFPGTRLNVPTEGVIPLIERHFGGVGYRISPMVPAGSVQWEGDVWRGGCSGNVVPEPGSWRTHMLRPRLWEGSAAVCLLSSLLNPNSYDDLQTLFDAYPDHIVEVSVLDRCLGTVPGRNTVVWEVRRY